jgi:hypothetical protein
MEKKDFEYFTNENAEHVYIEEREGGHRRFAVWQDRCLIGDCLSKKDALILANIIMRDIYV